MVNFESQSLATMAVAVPKQVLHLIILQRHSDLIEAIETFRKSPNTETIKVVRARMWSLFFHIGSAIKRSDYIDKERDFQELSKRVREVSVDDYEEIYFIISDWLDKKGITKVDTWKVVDSTDVEANNQAAGLY